ncbi:MAG: hypothetical protein IT363_07970 [Methanoregulaceae archaeon]|nr:hypothetical protein [Methanoregulaceae archaeon]
MTTHVLLATALAMGMATLGSAQVTPEARAERATQIYEKNIKLDLYNQILPLLLTKEQFRPILQSVERCRQRVTETEKLEYEELRKLEADMDKALKDAGEKLVIPPPELLTRISNTLKKLGAARRLIIQMNTDEVMEAFMKTANAGQQKAAANALNMALFAPGVKVETMKDEDKIRIFVQDVLLHPSAHEILKKLAL